MLFLAPVSGVCCLIEFGAVVKQTVQVLEAAHTSCLIILHARVAQSTTPPLCSPGSEGKERKEVSSSRAIVCGAKTSFIDQFFSQADCRGRE